MFLFGENTDKTVLDKFVFKTDNFETILKKTKPDNIYKGENYIKLIYNNFYKSKVEVLLVNDNIYSIRYYPLDKNFEKYKKHLNIKYNIFQKGVEQYWFNQFLDIKYNLNNQDWTESFIHYDSELLKKYPQYKDF